MCYSGKGGLTLVFLELVGSAADVAPLVLEFAKSLDLSSIWSIDPPNSAGGELHSPSGLVQNLRLLSTMHPAFFDDVAYLIESQELGGMDHKALALVVDVSIAEDLATR